ncbi:hypothetical protein D3C79_767470 [compost metagenome]
MISSPRNGFEGVGPFAIAAYPAVFDVPRCKTRLGQHISDWRHVIQAYISAPTPAMDNNHHGEGPFALRQTKVPKVVQAFSIKLTVDVTHHRRCTLYRILEQRPFLLRGRYRQWTFTNNIMFGRADIHGDRSQQQRNSGLVNHYKTFLSCALMFTSSLIFCQVAVFILD